MPIRVMGACPWSEGFVVRERAREEGEHLADARALPDVPDAAELANQMRWSADVGSSSIDYLPAREQEMGREWGVFSK